MAKTSDTAPTYPRTIWIAHTGQRMIKLTDSTASRREHARKVAGLETLNATRHAQGLEPLSPGPIASGEDVAHWLAPGLQRVVVSSPEFEREVLSAVEMFGRAGELDLVDGPDALSIKEAVALAKLSQNGAARKAWREAEAQGKARPAVLAAIDERDAQIKAHRSATDEQIDKLSSGGEAAS